MVARTPAEVVAGEAVFGSGQWEDMLGVASVISNRARQLGISPQQVVARQSEFNAYGKPLPKGQAKNVALAEKALRHVQEFGPVHHGMFFATPSTTRNLPKGLSRITQTKGHVYFSDPQRRPINTGVGTKRYQAAPAPIATAYAPQPKPAGAIAAIDRAISPRSIPTPTSRPQTQGPNRPAPVAPEASRFGAPASPAMTQDMRNRLAEQYGTKAGRVPSPSVSASTIARPTPRPSYTPPSTLTAAQTRNLAERLTPQTSLAMAPRPTSAPRSVSVAAPAGVTRAASLPTGLRTAPATTPRSVSVAAPAGVQRAASLPAGLQPAKGSRVATTPPAASLADRLGTFSPTRTAASLRTAPAPSITVGSVIGVTPAAASTATSSARPASRPAAAPTTTATPARTNFAGPIGSIRSLDARPTINPASPPSLAPSSVRSTAPARSVPAPTSRPSLTAPVTARSLGPTLSPQLSSFSPRPTAVAPSNLLSPTRAVPTPTAAPVRSVATPTARPQVQGPMRPASLVTPASSRVAAPTARPSVAAPATAPRVAQSIPSRIAAPTSRPTISAPTTVGPISSRPVSRTVSAPVSGSVPTPTARDPWGTMRTPVSAPQAVSQPGLASRLGLTPGRIAGSVIGSAIAGPIGGLVGGFLGGRIAPAPAGRVAAAPVSRPGLSFGGGMNGGSSMGGFGGGMGGRGASNQGSSLNGAGIGGGMSDRYGGFAGFSGDSSRTPGPDGGKVGGGGSKSSSSSGGKSSGGGKGKK